MSDLLLPAENVALTVARAQVKRGEGTTPNISAVLVMALDRLVDNLDGRVLHAECKHVADDTYCDPLCDAYVPGCGHFPIWLKDDADND